MTAVDGLSRNEASDRLTQIIIGMRQVFGDRASNVAQRQFELAEGEARLVWQRILSALSDR